MPVHFAFKFSKAKAAMLYLAERRLPDFTKGKVCKLLFFADKHHLVRHGRTVTGDSYSAMEHGPIPSRMLNILDAIEVGQVATDEQKQIAESIQLDRRFVYPHIVASVPPSMENLSQSDIDSLEETIREYGHRTFGELRALSHETPAYRKAWAASSKGSHPMEFEDFFEEDEAALVDVREEMIENDKLRKAFPEPTWL